MSIYKGRIRELFLHPLNVGEVSDADATGEAGSLVCGAALFLTIKLESPSGMITDARFKASGCGYLIAAASVLTESLKGTTIREATVLPTLFENVLTDNVGQVPLDKKHCGILCRDALGAALTAYRTSTFSEWMGDEALICTCFGVSETTIERAIQSAALHTVNEVTIACNAGGGCGSCQPLIEDILDDHWRSEVQG